MMNPKIFKAYDIRGKYPDELNEEAVGVITKTLAEKVFKKGDLIIAHDARLSSPALYKSVIEALSVKRLASSKSSKTPNPKRHTLIEVGLATTPMFYFLAASLKAAGGIMITASHNPKEYNGMKVVGPGAAIISGLEIQKLLD